MTTRTPILLTAFAVLAISSARAADFTWAGGTGNWTTTNWTPGPVAGPTTGANNVIITTGSVKLSSLVSYTGNTTINGGTLDLTGGGGIYNGGWNGSSVLTVSNAGTLTLDKWGYGPGGAAMNLGGLDYNPARFIINGGTVKFTGGAAGAPTNKGEAPYGPGFTIGANGTTLDAAKVNDTWTVKYDSRGYGPITSTAGGMLTLTGVGNGVFDKQLGGTGGLTKTGTGTWTLNRVNNFGGGTTVNAGILNLTAGGGAGTIIGNLIINSGATVKLGAVDALGYNSGTKVNLVTINGGAIDNSTTGNNAFATNFLLTGGVMSSTEGGNFVFSGGYGITTQTSAISSVISGGIRVAGGAAMEFNVADGTAANDLVVSGAISETGGVGGITKSGTGTMEISGTNTYTGTTTVVAGVLKVGPSALPGTSGVIMSPGAKLNLNYVGGSAVGSLTIGGTSLPSGIYNSGNLGNYISGTGSLMIGNADGIWISLVDGIWSTAANWQGDWIASGPDKTATFSQSTGVTVTLNNNRSIGNLSFSNSDYTITGTGVLTLESSATPSIAVASGRTATISAILGGALGMEKTGDGTLKLAAKNTCVGDTTVTAGTLELMAGGSSGTIRGNLVINSGATVKLGAVDALGYNGGTKVDLVTINGGTIDNTTAGNNASATNFDLTGGVMSATGGGTFGFSNGYGITTQASSTSSVISGGVVLRGGADIVCNVADGSAANDLVVSGTISETGGVGGITKDGDGTMEITGSCAYTGRTTLYGGELKVNAPSFSESSKVVIFYGAKMNLNFSGSNMIESLNIDGTRLPGGTYNAANLGDYISGTGSLVVPDSNGIWISTANGTWGTASNWQANAIAIGPDMTATFNQGTGVTVTLDKNRTIGNLAFSNSNYTIAGTNVLTLESSSATPSIAVASGNTAILSAILGGVQGLEKTGGGTLRLTAANTCTGTSVITSGTLELAPTVGAALRGTVDVESAGTLVITGADWLGLGDGIYSLNIHGGVVNNTLNNGFITNTLVSMTGGSISGGQFHWRNTSLSTFASANTATFSSNVLIRNDFSPGIPLTFTVEDGEAATDLLVSGIISQVVNNAALVKDGAGVLELSNTNTYTGNTSVYAGELKIDAPWLSDNAVVEIGTDAKLNLNFTGTDTVGGLVIDGTRLPGGTYDSSHPMYGSHFAGTGSLVILDKDGTWISTVNGTWGTAANWQANAIAGGHNTTATFSQNTGVTVTLDSGRTVGNLTFSNANYTVAGTSVLNLEASPSAPSVAVASGRTATISAILSGVQGLEKTGGGTLRLTASNTCTGTSVITSGTLELAPASGTPLRGIVNVESAATLVIAGADWVGLGTGINALNINGGTVNNTLGSTFVTSIPVSMTGGTISGGQLHWRSSTLNTIASENSATLSSNVLIRNDYSPGVPLTFSVEDGTAVTDLIVSGVISEVAPGAGLTKYGEGTMALSGINTYDGDTTVNGGTLELADNAQLKFKVTNAGSNVTTGLGNAVFKGDFNIDTSAVTSAAPLSCTLVSTAGMTFDSTFTVIGFTPQPDGITWTKAAGTNIWTFSESNGLLTLAASANDYGTWASSFSLTGSSTADDDNDGLTNGSEYAFGLVPNSGSSANPIAAQLNKTSGKFSYTRRDPALGTNLTYTIWTSSNLSSWTQDAGAAQTVSSTSGDIQTIEVTLSSSLLSDPKLFVQVRAN